MKILLINVTKDKGSTGSIASSLFKGYQELDHDTYLIYGRGDKVKSPNVFKPTLEFESKLHHLLSMFTGNMYGCMHISTYRIKRCIKRINPDVVHLHCLNGYFVNIYSLIKWLKKQPYKVILTMHADFMLSANCGYTEECDKWKCRQCKKCEKVKRFNGKYSLNFAHRYWKKMNKSFSNYPNDKLIITGVSPWLSERIKQSPIYNSFEIETALNPVDDFFYEKINVPKIDKQILYVTPDFYDHTKGGQNLITIAKMMPDYHFILVTSKDQDIDAPDNVTTVCKATREQLREFYHQSICTILLSKRETFSMVAAESLTCGTPVVGFKNGGTESWVNDDLLFVDYLSFDELVKVIKNVSNYKNSYNIIETMNYKTISKSYLIMMRNMYGK